MDVPVTTASGWNHLQELLFAHGYNEGIGRFRSAFVFRGLSDADHPLTTTLQRLGGDYVKLERHLIRNFKKYAHRDAVEKNTVWHWLSVAQHHGLPTRLLDWSFSPLVSAHFATANLERFDRDSLIWKIDMEQAHRRLPAVLREALDREGANTFTADILGRTVTSLEEFDAISDEPFLLFFEPPSLDERIVNQYALFSVMSQPTLSLVDWARANPDCCECIRIPSATIWEIRDKLDQCNITERVLFPGLDGLSTWLRRHYAPVNKGG